MRDSEAEKRLESGWVLRGEDGDGRPLRLSFGETELSRAYLGVTVGRHPALCERVIADPGISRRHFRIGLSGGAPFVEDLNSLNGTLLDGVPLLPFQPASLSPGQRLDCGRVRLTLAAVGEPGLRAKR
jgi:pSer/pThr/pTyr-binding forkhead associated (FHA) protein